MCKLIRNGLFKAGRYDTLFRWLSVAVSTWDVRNKPAVCALFLDAWAGGEKDIWNYIEGFEGRKTPLSDYLNDIFAGWASDYVLSDRNFSRLFETFEVLAAPVYVTLKVEKPGLTEALKLDRGRGERDFVWSPIGRAAWDTEHRSPF